MLSFFDEQQEAEFHEWFADKTDNKIWIGLTDQNENYEFLWEATNSPPSYEHWGFGEPGSESAAGGRCVSIGPDGGQECSTLLYKKYLFVANFSKFWRKDMLYHATDRNGLQEGAEKNQAIILGAFV